MTLAQEERVRGREAELERISAMGLLGQQEGRERRTREIAVQGNEERQEAFQQRATSVNPWTGPEGVDPRETLGREELAAVNRQAKRIHEDVRESGSRAAIARRLAGRVADGDDPLSAVAAVKDAVRTADGTVVPIEALGTVSREEVSIRGEIETLWDASSTAIQQVGLIGDDTGRTTFTSWKRSRAPMVREGDGVVLRAVAKSWYQGRCSVALTGQSRVEFPGRDRR